jgi:hypothetical protein
MACPSGLSWALVGIVRWIEKLLIARASMSLESYYIARKREIDSCFTFMKRSV